MKCEATQHRGDQPSEAVHVVFVFEQKTNFHSGGGPRPNINPSVSRLNGLKKIHCVANHLGEVVAGTLGLGDPLQWVQADDDGGPARVTINALSNSDVGAAISLFAPRLP